MSFTDGKPRVATEDDCKAPWSGNPKNFRCGFCGHRFKVGDYWRFQYTNDIAGASGNPLVCKSCDAPKDVLVAKWKQMHDDAKEKFWWFTRPD